MLISKRTSCEVNDETIKLIFETWYRISNHKIINKTFIDHLMNISSPNNHHSPVYQKKKIITYL